MLGQDDLEAPPILPIGLMAVRAEPPEPAFLGLEFRVEMPLDVQDYSSTQTCASNWVMLVPPDNSEFATVRERIGPRLEHWEKSRTVFEDIPPFREWARSDDAKTASTVLATLSHHDRDRLYFASESIMSTGFHRRFNHPSIAILDGCGTGNMGAADIVRALNQRGVSAVIATSTEISPALGADFLASLDDTLNGSPAPMPLELAMFTTLRTLAQKSRSPASGPYGPLVLTYALLGNGQLPVCAVPKKEN